MSARWLLLLCAYLLVWVPLNFAGLATQSFPSLDHRGAAAVVELAVHTVSAMICAAAGWMLWTQNPAGGRLACAALIVDAAVTVHSLYDSALPRDVRPGVALPLAAVSAAHALAWIVYLNRTGRLS